MGILDRIASTLDGRGGDANDADAADVARAQALATAGDADGAEAVLVEVTRRSPRQASAFRALGLLESRRGALDHAVTSLGRAVDIEPGDAAAWLDLGDALARLGRDEPARDALRRALTLGFDPTLRRRAHAALGRVHAAGGRLTQAARELRAALDLFGPDDDDREAALAYARVLARAGERDASEWLTRAARAPGADARVFAEAADADDDPATAERLLREGLDRAPDDPTLQAALIRLLARTGRAEQAIALGQRAVARADDRADDDVGLWTALRAAFTASDRFSDAAAAAAEETRRGAPPTFETRVAIALGAEDAAALAATVTTTRSAADRSPAEDAVRAFVASRATEADLLALGRLAPGDAARRFLARAGAPPPVPQRQLAGMLMWAHAFAAATPALYALAPTAARAAEALDRPLSIAVMGEFNAGKSSVVNALAGDEVAPTGVTPTTATINVLRYGATPAARVLRHDGAVRELPAATVAAFLAALTDEDARDIRQVEILLPIDALRRVEIVDTPGLNAIRSDHERTAREFLHDADAIVWVFAVGQAAKASERDALAFARAAGKRVLGVLNKVDRADAAETAAVLRHVTATFGAAVDAVVPLSATRALAARRAGVPDAAFEALMRALDDQFFSHALTLKRDTARAALRRFVADARAAAVAPSAPDTAAAHATLQRIAERALGVVDSERVALRARLDDGYRRVAQEIREFVRPRSWLFGGNRATPADEEFLTELLEDAVERAAGVTRRSLHAALAADRGGAEPADGAAATTAFAIDAGHAVDVALGRFAAYASGVIEGGAVPDFFRHQLPRLKLDVGAIRDALVRRAPDPEQALFEPLRRAMAAAYQHAAADLDARAADAAMRALLFAARVEQPLAELARAVDDLPPE